jgi:hypothetical protein
VSPLQRQHPPFGQHDEERAGADVLRRQRRPRRAPQTHRTYCVKITEDVNYAREREDQQRRLGIL